jgi:hypothetical protein
MLVQTDEMRAMLKQAGTSAHARTRLRTRLHTYACACG